MSNILYQFAAGLLWLFLLFFSENLGIQSQYITLLRTTFLCLFSVFLITAISSNIKQEKHSYLLLLCLIPSFFYLYLAKAQYTEFLFFTKFFFIVLLFLLFRESKGHTKSAYWDMSFPAIAAFLIYFEIILTILFFVSIFLIYRNYRFSFDSVESSNSLIKMLPLILISPLLPILYRDDISFDIIEISRANLEIIGMILSGGVAAFCNGLTMSYEKLLNKISLLMAFFGILFFIIAFYMASIAIYLILYEYVRAIMWIALTHFYKSNGAITSFFAGTVTALIPILFSKVQINEFDINGLFIGLILCTILILILNQLSFFKGKVNAK